jgi:hypothetical protein
MPTFFFPSGYWTVRHGIDGPNRNRWFTELKNGGSFHGKLLVITRWYHIGDHQPAVENGSFIDMVYRTYGDFPWQTVSHNQRVWFVVFRSQVPKIVSGGNFGSVRFEKSSGWAGAMPGPPLKQPPGRHGWGHRRANSVGEHMRVS